MKRLALGFIAGFVATLVFHQIALLLIREASGMPIPVWDLTPVPPLGVPRVISLAFWGGIWGIGLAWIEPHLLGSPAFYWISVAALGAVLPTSVYLFVVRPLKGDPGDFAQVMIGGLIVNAAWGVGTALILRLAERRRPA